jgi:hypothetical protein
MNSTVRLIYLEKKVFRRYNSMRVLRIIIAIFNMMVIYQLISPALGQPIDVLMGGDRVLLELPTLPDFDPNTLRPRCNNITTTCSFTISVPDFFSKITIYKYNGFEHPGGGDLRQEIRTTLIDVLETSPRSIAISQIKIDKCDGYEGTGYSKLDQNEEFSVIAYWKDDYNKCVILSNFPDAWVQDTKRSFSITNEDA